MIVAVKFWSFCSTTGALSISNNKYEPPWRSNPKLIFLSKKLSSTLNKFDDAIKINKSENRVINNMRNYEK